MAQTVELNTDPLHFVLNTRFVCVSDTKETKAATDGIGLGQYSLQFKTHIVLLNCCLLCNLDVPLVIRTHTRI